MSTKCKYFDEEKSENWAWSSKKERYDHIERNLGCDLKSTHGKYCVLHAPPENKQIGPFKKKLANIDYNTVYGINFPKAASIDLRPNDLPDKYSYAFSPKNSDIIINSEDAYIFKSEINYIQLKGNSKFDDIVYSSISPAINFSTIHEINAEGYSYIGNSKIDMLYTEHNTLSESIALELNNCYVNKLLINTSERSEKIDIADSVVEQLLIASQVDSVDLTRISSMNPIPIINAKEITIDQRYSGNNDYFINELNHVPGPITIPDLSRPEFHIFSVDDTLFTEDMVKERPSKNYVDKFISPLSLDKSQINGSNIENKFMVLTNSDGPITSLNINLVDYNNLAIFGKQLDHIDFSDDNIQKWIQSGPVYNSTSFSVDDIYYGNEDMIKYNQYNTIYKNIAGDKSVKPKTWEIVRHKYNELNRKTQLESKYQQSVSYIIECTTKSMTSPRRVLQTSLGSIILFGVLYSITNYIQSNLSIILPNNQLLSESYTILYYIITSLSRFTAIGEQETVFITLLASMEAGIGIILLTVFIVTYTQRINRS